MGRNASGFSGAAVGVSTPLTKSGSTDLSGIIVDCSRWIVKSSGFGGARSVAIRRERFPLNPEDPKIFNRLRGRQDVSTVGKTSDGSRGGQIMFAAGKIAANGVSRPGALTRCKIAGGLIRFGIA
jgi:hypothetical protein